MSGEARLWNYLALSTDGHATMGFGLDSLRKALAEVSELEGRDDFNFRQLMVWSEVGPPSLKVK